MKFRLNFNVVEGNIELTASEIAETFSLDDEDEEKKCGCLEEIRNGATHFSNTKNEWMYVKDMEKYHLMASLKNGFRDKPLGQLYESDEFKSMILNLADYISSDVEEEEEE